MSRASASRGGGLRRSRCGWSPPAVSGASAAAATTTTRTASTVRPTRNRHAPAAAAERFFTTLGKAPEWVADAPGMVLGRIVCQVINEAAFALGEGVGSAEDIDAGMVHGLNYPRGILAWADAIGLDHVLAVLLALCDERREERYRPAPVLTRLVLSGRLGRLTGGGFFD